MTAEPASVNLANPKRPDTWLHRQAWLLALAAASASVICLVLGLADRSTLLELRQRERRVASLAADARTIAALRARPQRATQTRFEASELLKLVGAAMTAAGIEPEALLSTQPEPPRRIGRSDLAEVPHRLVLEKLTLRQVAEFGQALAEQTPPLRLAGIQLRAPAGRELWDAEISVATLVLAPTRQADLR